MWDTHMFAQHRLGQIHPRYKKSLAEALRDNDPTKVRKLLQTGINPNTEHGGSRPVLAIAIQYCPRVVPLLLQYGANPLEMDVLRQTPLALAIRRFEYATVRHMILFLKRYQRSLVWFMGAPFPLNTNLRRIIVEYATARADVAHQVEAAFGAPIHTFGLNETMCALLNRHFKMGPRPLTHKSL